MPRAKQLEREIKAALAKQVPIKKLFAWRPKLETTIVDIAEGRGSRSTGQPLRVSQLDTPRGAWLIIDGHHRAVEAAQAGQSTIAIEVDRYVPWIERTGGAYREHVENKVNVADFVRRR